MSAAKLRLHALARRLGILLLAQGCTALAACGGSLPPPQPVAAEAQAAPAPREPPVAQVAAGDPSARPPLEQLTPIRLARPAFDYTLNRPAPGPGGDPPRLTGASEQKNTILDETAWFTRNGLSLPALRLPEGVKSTAGDLAAVAPAQYHGRPLVQGVDQGDAAVLLYAGERAARFAAVLDKARRPVAIVDFESFLAPPAVEEKDAMLVGGDVVWAMVQDGVLYASTGHSTYAASSRGKNAFISAIDLRSGELLWQSAPLVSNARNFVLRGGYILCGYGFTAEPDFLYVLDRATGKTVNKVPLKSGPDYLIEKDGKLFVRTYDTDVVFEIR